MTTRVLCIGDSITVGFPNTDSYRARLRFVSDADIEFVGSLTSGDTNIKHDPECYAISGYRIDEVSSGAIADATLYNPDIVLIHLGTNDCVQNYDVANAHTRLSNLADSIGDVITGGRSVVYVATIIPIGPTYDPSANYLTFNSNLRTLSGSKSWNLVEIANSFTYSTDYYDNAHLTDYGYDRMAVLWATALGY